MPDYQPFVAAPRAPGYTLPPGACDSQFHVFGPADRYPVRPGAAYEMPTATWEVARRLHGILGIERGVVVQATTYGADHQVVLDALAALNEGGKESYKGCANALALVEGDDRAIARLHDGGIRGARFTRGGLGIRFSPADMDRALGRVRELGWYLKVQPEPGGIAEQMKAFDKLELPVVMDHMGRIDPARGDDDPSLHCVLELLRRGNFWVMLSLSEKLSKTGEPWDDVIPLAQRLIDTAPDRCIWASDWPHPVSVKATPNEGALLDLLERFAPDDAMRHRILVDNPAALFGFATE